MNATTNSPKAKQEPIENTPLALSDLIKFHENVIPAFQEKWERGARNEARMLAENWTEEQRKKIEAQGRQPYSFPIAASYVQRIVAMQRQSRQGWKTEPKLDPNDEIKAELAGILLRNYEEENAMPEIESQVFLDGLALSYGADKFVIDFETGKIKNVQVDYLNLVWDINAKEDDLSDALFIAEIERVYRKDLPEAFQNATDTNFMGREAQSYFVYSGGDGRAYDLVSVFHHFQRVKKKFWVIYIKDSHNILNLPTINVRFARKKDAEELANLIDTTYASYGLDPTGEWEIRREEHDVWDYYKFNYAGIMEYRSLNWEYHPYNVYRSIRVKNDWISLLDFMESPQLMLDRVISQVDYSLRKELKQVYELDITKLAEGETPESATRKMSKTGGVIYKKGDGRVISEATSHGINPQYLQVTGLTTEFLSELVGGKNLLGQQESASESGRAVALRQQQGKLVAYLFLSNLERYKLVKGRKLLYFIQKYDTAERIIRANGANLKPEIRQALMQTGAMIPARLHQNLGFVKVNFDEITMLRDAELEVKVETAPLTDTERGYKLAQMNEVERTTPVLQQSLAWQLEKLKYLDIDATVREKIISELTGRMQQEQAQAQEEMNVKKAEILLKHAPKTTKTLELERPAEAKAS